jgi:dihydrofolate reductase
MKIKMIVALDSVNGIGKNGKLPWHIPEDLKHFAKLTKGEGKNAVLMGRKTHESIGKKLPGRTNIVLTTQTDLVSEEPDLIFMNSISDVLDYSNNLSLDDLWIIGGGKIYDLFFKKTIKIDKLYVTEINGNYDCDTFFTNNYRDYFTFITQKELTHNVDIFCYYN